MDLPQSYGSDVLGMVLLSFIGPGIILLLDLARTFERVKFNFELE